jgi:redox-sensitive bicupin YhaK (pirin superfamily)
MTRIVVPRVHDIGGFEVRRAVPSIQARSVGPFVFVDHMGPATFQPGHGIDVRPHPHIGLATVTFLWEGRLRHRDTIGTVQDIGPGDVNWMTAGRGIAHSERTAPETRGRGQRVHGLQTWVALPKTHEEMSPEFHHHVASSLPVQQRDGTTVRIIAGRAYGEESPVRVFAETLYVAIDLDADAEIDLEATHRERALYLLQGEAQLDGADVPSMHLLLLDDGVRHRLRAKTPIAAMLLGGEPLDAPRHMWWNFVSSSKERIEQAKQDWVTGVFGEVLGETEFIPLPER